MTVCPCAQESVEKDSKDKLLEFVDEETTQKVLEMCIRDSNYIVSLD